MLVNLDAKGLEWVCALFLSQDQVGIQEQIDNIDVHSNNQQRFGLPTRLTAKTYLFRLIYGGSAYSYSVDPDFVDVSTSQSFWSGIIEATYDKYTGLARWHESIIDEAIDNGKLTILTGREYNFVAKRNKRGELVWPRTQILNYPVQGLGADVMAIIRVILYRLLKTHCPEALMVCTVHDSVLIDVPHEYTSKVVELCYQTFDQFPEFWKKVFNCEFNVPLRVEVQVGDNWGQMKEVKRGLTNEVCS
jgi:DNA polymerase-1